MVTRALALLHTQVTLEPPSAPDALSIMRGLRARLERHHGVRITDSALSAAVTLSDRYITDRWGGGGVLLGPFGRCFLV